MLKVIDKPDVEKTITGVAKPTPAEIERRRMLEWFDQHVADAASGPKTEVVTITPVLASLLLSRNVSNRKISETNLDRIKRDILAGRWEFNGDTLSVSKDGFLNNGQHRCRAVVETNRTIKAIMVFGVERHSRMTLDQGVTRTVGHYVGMSGHTDANTLATVAGYVWQFKETGRLSISPDSRPTKSEVLLTIDHYIDIPDSLKQIPFNGGSVLCSRSILAFCHWAIANRAGSVNADAFVERLLTGDNLAKGDPILYCRNRLLEMRRDGARGANDRVELIFKTWNHHRRGEVIDRITLGNNKLPALEA